MARDIVNTEKISASFFYFFRLLFAAIADRMPFIYLIADFLLNNHSIAFIPTPILHAYTSYVPWGVARAAPFIRSSEIYLSPSPSPLSLWPVAGGGCVKNS